MCPKVRFTENKIKSSVATKRIVEIPTKFDELSQLEECTIFFTLPHSDWCRLDWRLLKEYETNHKESVHRECTRPISVVLFWFRESEKPGEKNQWRLKRSISVLIGKIESLRESVFLCMLINTHSVIIIFSKLRFYFQRCSKSWHFRTFFIIATTLEKWRNVINEVKRCEWLPWTHDDDGWWSIAVWDENKSAYAVITVES